jgi:sugar phosphate isomerase/epimerase
VQHIGHGRQALDPRKIDAAFSSLEHLAIFAKGHGVTIALENTPGELGSPETLVQFIKDTHLNDLKLCFDIGHAHMEDGVMASFETMRERIVTAHIHDNHGDKDEHLLPYEGTIDWDAALVALAQAPLNPALVMELKEQASAAPTLDQVHAAFDRLEEDFERARAKSAS